MNEYLVAGFFDGVWGWVITAVGGATALAVLAYKKFILPKIKPYIETNQATAQTIADALDIFTDKLAEKYPDLGWVQDLDSIVDKMIEASGLKDADRLYVQGRMAAKKSSLALVAKK